MNRPADIQAAGRLWCWDRLDPAKAYMGATWGLRGPKGSTFILWPDDRGDYSHHLTAVGLWSGRYDMTTGRGADSIIREIESLAECHPGQAGIDRWITRADYLDWQATA